MGAAAHTVVIIVKAHALEEWHRQGAAKWAGERGVFVGMGWAGWQRMEPTLWLRRLSIVVLGLGVGYRGNGDFAVFEVFAIFNKQQVHSLIRNSYIKKTI